MTTNQTPTNPTEAAAGRLRRASDFDDPAEFEDVVYAGEHYGPYEDQCLLAEAMEKELDPTLIDESFARSLAVESGEWHVNGPRTQWWCIPATNETQSNRARVRQLFEE